jgi:lipoprotein-anchoring transpeptidase ErfK/SrfK
MTERGRRSALAFSRRATNLLLSAAIVLPLMSALALSPPALAQDGGIVPVVTDEAIAVVDGFDVPQVDGAWQDPNAISAADPNAVWTDPAAAPAEGEWVDPASDPNAVPVDETWVDPNAPVAPAPDPNAVPLDQLPPMTPMGPPASVLGGVLPDVNWTPPTKVYVAESGQPLGGGFLDIWRQWGGALSWGYPLTPEITENGRTVQYFGFGRFEFAPEDPDGNFVQFGNVGSEMRPFVLRRGAATPAVTEAAQEAAAWLPADDALAADPTVRFVPETGHTVSGDMLAFWTQTGEAAYLGNPVSEPFVRAGVTYQMFERGRVAQEPGGWPYVLPAGELLAARYGIDTTPAPQADLPVYSEALWTPPTGFANANLDGIAPDPNGARRVLISLSQQYAWAFQGDVVMWQGYVSTGLPQFATPPGSFSVLTKYKTQTMEGVLGGEYYNVPDVPDILYFTNQGHAIHGTYWHNNFGAPMSHGCVNLPMEVATWMYDWAPMGMTVDIVP